MQRAGELGIQFMIIYSINASRFWKHMANLEMSAEILGKREGKNACLGRLWTEVCGVDESRWNY
jgi:hypothetical protein